MKKVPLTARQWEQLQAWCEQNSKRIRAQGLVEATKVANYPPRRLPLAYASIGWTPLRGVQPDIGNLQEIMPEAHLEPLSRDNPAS